MPAVIRRFESGSIESLINSTLDRAGLGEPIYCYGKNKRKPFTVAGKTYSYDELVSLVDQLRVAEGREPLRCPGRTPRRPSNTMGLNPIQR